MIMEDWRLEIYLIDGEILEFKFDSLDEIYNFTRLYLKSTLSIHNIKSVIVTDNCEFISLEVNKYDSLTQSLYREDVDEFVEAKTVPEFLTVHTNEGLTPDINIELA